MSDNTLAVGCLNFRFPTKTGNLTGTCREAEMGECSANPGGTGHCWRAWTTEWLEFTFGGRALRPANVLVRECYYCKVRQYG